MANRRKDRTLPEKLYNANVFSNGALFDIPYTDLAIVKIEEHAKKLKNAQE